MRPGIVAIALLAACTPPEGSRDRAYWRVVPPHPPVGEPGSAA